MPIYEYECEKCHHRFEVMQHFSDDPVEICPDCQGHVHRVIQPVGIVFKGSGFYITDNRRSGGKTSAGIPVLSGNGRKKKGRKKEPAPAAGSTDSKSSVSAQAKED
jgi:putative FmdB family regulatory protein